MITAHLPSGYVLGRLLPKRPYILTAAIVGGVLPDLDLIWFYLIDDRAFHHHRYWVHIPLFWALVAGVALPVMAWARRDLLAPAMVFFAALLMHICLDTIAGDVLWHWPWSDHMTHLITVPAAHDNWVLNFILHPVFALELLIWATALLLFKRSR